MNLLNLLLHASAIIAAIKNIEAVAQGCLAQKRTPTANDDLLLIDSAEALIKADVISIPGLTDDEIIASLEEVRALIKAQIPAPAAPAAP